MSTLKFTAEHEWLRLDGDVATLGITDYAQDALGDIVFIQLPEVGAELAVDEEAAVIESVKAAGGLKIVLTGTVTEVNEAIVDNPALVNEDPMGEGWFFRMRLDDPAGVDGLLDQAAYDKLIS